MISSITTSFERTSKVSQLQLDCMEEFGISLDIKKILFDDISSGMNSYTTIFKTKDDGYYAYCVSTSNLTLADIKAIIKNLGLKIDKIFPPDGDSKYFLNFGREFFNKVFPARKNVSDEQVIFYQTLAPYKTGLIKLEPKFDEIKTPEDFDSNWLESFENTSVIRSY